MKLSDKAIRRIAQNFPPVPDKPTNLGLHEDMTLREFLSVLENNPEEVDFDITLKELMSQLLKG